MITQLRYTVTLPFVEHLMAVKNKVEIEGLKRSYTRDGLAYVSSSTLLSLLVSKNEFAGPIPRMAGEQVTRRI